MNLVERLRSVGAFPMGDDGSIGEFSPNALTHEAAARIEQLEAELARRPPLPRPILDVATATDMLLKCKHTRLITVWVESKQDYFHCTMEIPLNDPDLHTVVLYVDDTDDDRRLDTRRDL